MSKTTTAKQLREKYGVKPSEAVSARMKEQTKTINKIAKAVSSNPKTISEISGELGIDLKVTAWYVFTMTRHKKLRAVRKNEDGYWSYTRTSEGGD
jgi:intein-encoded DNA endonuclease-like protein